MNERIFGYKDPNLLYHERIGAYGVGFDHDGNVPVVITPLYNGEKGYFLLGGGLAKGENHSECIQRECMEEAGLQVTVKHLIGKGDYYCLIEETQTHFHGVGYFYYIEIGAVVAKPTELNHSLHWLTAAEIKTKLFLPHQIWAVEEAHKTLGK